MNKLFGSLFFILLSGMMGLAEVDIPQEIRVKNLDSGVCVWCAIENLANVHGIERLKGIAKYRDDNYGKKLVFVQGGLFVDRFGNWFQTGGHWQEINEAPGSIPRVLQEFERLNIKNYKIQNPYDYSQDILKEAVDKNLGCAIALKDYPSLGDRHMVTMTDLTEEKVVFVDNNGNCERIEKSRDWFNNHWDGYTILLYPEFKNAELIKEEPKEIKKK